MGIGEAIRLWAMSYLGRPARSMKIQANRLVTEGPFRFVRNPIYLANIIIYIGTSIVANFWMPYFLLVVMGYFSIQYFFIVLSEEAVLTETFGDRFFQYCSAVPRFIPALKPLTSGNFLTPSWKTGVRTEKSTFLSLSIILLMFVVRMVIW